MKKLLNKISLKSFKFYASLFCLLGDLLIVTYIYSQFKHLGRIKLIILKALQNSGHNTNLISPDMIHQQALLMLNVLLTMLVGVVIIHLIIYILFLFNRKLPRQYMKVVAWIGFPSFILMGISVGLGYSVLKGDLMLGGIFILQGVLYLFTAQGMSHFFGEKQVVENSSSNPQSN